MDILREAAFAYNEIAGKNYEYTFSDGSNACIKFRTSNFRHLAGLGKLKDLYWFNGSTNALSATRSFREVMDGRISLNDIKCSVFFDSDLNDRICSFAKLDDLLKNGKAIFPFVRSKCKIQTRLKSSLILFKDFGYNFYLTFGAAQEAINIFYPETFFLRYDRQYIEGQKIIYIDDLKITKT